MKRTITMTNRDKRIVKCLENLQCMANTTAVVLASLGHMSQIEIDKYAHADTKLRDTLDSLRTELEGDDND